jgi:hypothetical protein
LPDDCSSKPANTESISHCGAIAIAASDSAKNGYPSTGFRVGTA